MTLDDLPTPCLLVEKRRLEANLERMQAKAAAERVALRPHIKTHKSVAVARRQRALGARGITVATVDEAEVFAHAGFTDVRVAYPVIGEDKHGRLLRLMEADVRVSFCVDTERGARAASDVYGRHGRRAEVLVEVDTGHGRCGVPWDARELVLFAQLVSDLPGLKPIGILTHEGHAYHGPVEGETSAEALRRVAEQARNRMLEVAARLRTPGVPEAIPGRLEVSIGSTPSMSGFENAEREGFRITEIRPGNYVFHDATQVALGAATLADCALTALATVVSKRRDGVGRERLYLDAGKKVLTSDRRPGLGRTSATTASSSTTPPPCARCRTPASSGFPRSTGGWRSGAAPRSTSATASGSCPTTPASPRARRTGSGSSTGRRSSKRLP